MAPLGSLFLTAGKKAALTGLGVFAGVGGAVAYKLDQVITWTFLPVMIFKLMSRFFYSYGMMTIYGLVPKYLSINSLPNSQKVFRYLFFIFRISYLFKQLFYVWQEVKADLTIHAPNLPWSHSGPFDSLDHASIRSIYEIVAFSYVICKIRAGIKAAHVNSKN